MIDEFEAADGVPECATYAQKRLGDSLPHLRDAFEAFLQGDSNGYLAEIREYNLDLGRAEGYLVALGVTLIDPSEE